MFSVECIQHSTLNIQHYSSTAACAAANFEAIMLISMIYVWTGQHLSCNFRAFCTFFLQNVLAF